MSGSNPFARHLNLVLPPHLVAHMGVYLDPLVVTLLLVLTYPVKWTYLNKVIVTYL